MRQNIDADARKAMLLIRLSDCPLKARTSHCMEQHVFGLMPWKYSHYTFQINIQLQLQLNKLITDVHKFQRAEK